MERYLCIHGHFYQPPRENPWLDDVELQDSAEPFHDWNERVTAECYWPNAAARILDREGWIARITNNYERMSVNFGPTLLSWLERHRRDVYAAILEADRGSMLRFSGHGSAMAQAYNHMIMPLANARDRQTQVRWGVADFEYRFGRRPEGMWLAETAVDTATLEALADAGIRFTVLAPRQARRARPLGASEWSDVSSGNIDPKRAYVTQLPSGRTIALFFYDGPISQGVAFEGLLNDGERFARRLTGAFDDKKGGVQLVHIATDGETYGHHHRYGEMALAYALDFVGREELATLTNYGEFLERFPPSWEVEIAENTSWSCAHGVERWRSDCGCTTGDSGDRFSQAWRKPLREALDALRDRLIEIYEREGAGLFQDAWAARDAYIDVILDRDFATGDALLEQQLGRPATPEEAVRAFSLLEMQRHAMLMYTSCGWFFDEVSRIETVQILRYAARAIQLAERFVGPGLETDFLARLEAAESNVPRFKNARHIYETEVRDTIVDLPKLVAHYAVSSLFGNARDATRTFAWRVEPQHHTHQTAGRAQLALGRVTVTSELTRERQTLAYGVLHLGDHNLSAGVRSFPGAADYLAASEEIVGAFQAGRLADALRKLDAHFLDLRYSLETLFRDEQRRVIGELLEGTLQEAEALSKQVYLNHGPLIGYVSNLDMPMPKPLRVAVDFVLNAGLRRELDREEIRHDRVRALLADAKRFHVELDAAGVSYRLQAKLEELAIDIRHDPFDRARLARTARAVELARQMPFDVDLSRVQNAFFLVMHETFATEMARLAADPERVFDWRADFDALGALLRIRVPTLRRKTLPPILEPPAKS